MAAMQRDYYYPRLADRDAPVTWEEEGAKDIWSKANERAREVLASHYPSYIDGAPHRHRSRADDIGLMAANN